MCHHLKKIVSCDYDIDIDKFTEIFDREIVQPYNEKIKSEMDYVNRQVKDAFVKMERSFKEKKEKVQEKVPKEKEVYEKSSLMRIPLNILKFPRRETLFYHFITFTIYTYYPSPSCRLPCRLPCPASAVAPF